MFSQSRPLIVLVIAAFLIAGCAGATSSGQDPKFGELDNQSRAIDQTEKHCIDDATAWGDSQMTMPAGDSTALSHSSMQKVKSDRDQKVTDCQTKAATERQQLAARERALYQAEVENQGNLRRLLPQIIGSKPQ